MRIFMGFITTFEIETLNETPLSAMSQVKFYRGGDLPLELHKVRVVQKLHLVPIERRLDAMKEA